MASAINEWRAIADYHKQGLAQAEAKIAELSPPVAKLATKTEVMAHVVRMAANDSKADKAAWKKLVARGMVQNVQGILADCYTSLRLKDRNPEGWKAARALGGRDTFEWQFFGLKVIRLLKANNSFGIGSEDGLDDFEDTAGGCDEVAWNAACSLLATPAPAAPEPAPAAPEPAPVAPEPATV